MVATEAIFTIACRMGNFDMLPLLFSFVLPVMASIVVAVAVTGFVGVAIFRQITSK